jgi:hypothetical protein
MIPGWRQALRQAAAALAPGGSLHIVDFGQQERLPRAFRSALGFWLGWFHVEPRAGLHRECAALAKEVGGELEFRRLYGGYVWSLRLTMPASQASDAAAARTGTGRADGRGQAHRRLKGRPVDDLEAAVEVLHQRGAAFDPVAVVAVVDGADLAHLGRVDMAADDAVGAVPRGLPDQRVLEVRDELHRRLDLALEQRRQRPVRQTEKPAHPVHQLVEVDRRS